MLLCSGEKVHVVSLPPTPPWERKPRPRSLCAKPTPPSQLACDWYGRSLPGRLHGVQLYQTGSYILDSIFFSRVVSSCRAGADDATLHLVPFPAADARVTGCLANLSDYVAATKAALRGSAAWQRCGGCDHILVTARAISDLFCSPQKSYRGVWSGVPPAFAARPFCIEDPFWAQSFKLSVEVGHNRAIAPDAARIQNLYSVPYESGLHVRSASEMRHWQASVLAQPRPNLVTLVTASSRTRGAERSGTSRGSLLAACRRANGTCTAYDCAAKKENCRKKVVLSAYLRSQFCLMPTGDTPSRNALFDALVCGCVPIIYHRASFSFPWHVPNASAVVLLAPPPTPQSLMELQLRAHLLTAGNIGIRRPVFPEDRIDRALAAIHALRAAEGEQAVARMRGRIVELLPSITYSHSSDGPPDAITVTLNRIRTTMEARRLQALGLDLVRRR